MSENSANRALVILKRCGLTAAVIAGTALCIILLSIFTVSNLQSIGLLGEVIAHPKFGYVNVQQSLLSKKIKNKFDDYFYFVDKADPLNPEISTTGWQLIPWRYLDRRSVETIGEWVLQRAPGLVLRASHGHRIALCRVSSFANDSTFKVSWLSVGNTSAIAKPGVITFANNFFFPHDQFEAFVHELVHAADADSRTAHSHAWVSFAQPIISKIEKEYKNTPEDQIYAFDNKLRKEGLWPSLYGCTNLSEGLAEYMAEYIVGSNFQASQTFVDQVASNFLNPNYDDLICVDIYTQAHSLMLKENYLGAAERLQELNKIDPESPIPYCDLAQCLLHSNKYDEAAAAADLGIAHLGESVPASDPAKLRIMLLRAWLYERENDYYQATKLFDQIWMDPDLLRVPLRQHAGN